MKTQKKLSTITYNTEKFLVNKLNDLLSTGVIVSWFYIKHKAEEDTKKEHIHLLVEPATRIDTVKLQHLFVEPSIISPDSPLGCMPFQTTSNFADWYLYIIHDIDYLREKGLVKKYHYKKEEVKTSNNDYFDSLVSDINFNALKPKSQIRDLICQGWSWAQILFNTNLVPIQQMKQYKEYYDMCYVYCYNEGLIINTNDVKNANLENMLEDVEKNKKQ